MKKLYLFFAVLCAVLGTQTVNATIYFDANSWADGNAKMSAYFWNGSSNQWVEITDKNSDGFYVIEVPSGTWSNVLFTRGYDTANSQDWDYLWNQTTDQTFTNGALYKFTGYDEGNKDNKGRTRGKIDVDTNYTPGVDTEQDKKKWTITASESEPAVFLVGDYLNFWRPTPEYQLTKTAAGIYELKDFVIPEGADFLFRIYKSSSSFKDYSRDYAINDFKDVTITGLSEGNASHIQWNRGQTMVSVTLDIKNGTLDVDINEDVPSMDGSAKIKGIPYVSLVGDKFTQAEKINVPNYDRSWRKPTTKSGWADGFVQYDAEGNVLVYGDNLASGASYGEGATAGYAMYNTIWPPRNPISFKNGDFEFTSDRTTFRYDRQEKKTITQADGHTVTANYAVYVIDYIWMEGRYKIWSGWAGMMDYDLYSDSKDNYGEWRTHYNYGSGAWSEDNSDEIKPDIYYGLNRSVNVKDFAGAGGNFNFDNRYYFSKVEFWYNIDDNATNKNSAFIGYLANGDPRVKNTRTGKQEVTGTYDVVVLVDENGDPLSDRKITDWSVALYRESANGDTFIKSIGANGVSIDAENLHGEFPVDNLESGVYYYKMEVTYAAGGNVVEAQTLSTQSNRVRIFGVAQPADPTLVQITEKNSEGKTLYSFDLELKANAPAELKDVKCLDKNGNEVDVLSLADLYVVGMPKYGDGTTPLYTSVSAKNKKGEVVEIKELTREDLQPILHPEDLKRYNFETTTYLGVAPDKTINPTEENSQVDYAMPTFTFKNVIPGNYTAYVSLGASDGDFGDGGKWEEYNVMSASASVEMYVPSTYYMASEFEISPVDETSSAIDESLLPMGVTETQPMAYTKANKISTTNGRFEPLMVTNGVLADWSMDYTVKLTDVRDINGNTKYTYTLEGITGKALNEEVPANFDYLPIGYTEAGAGFNTCPIEKIAGIKSRTPNGGKFGTTTTVGYRRNVPSYTTGVVATTEEYPAGGTFDPEKMINGEYLVEYTKTDAKTEYQIEKSYNWIDETIDCFANYFVCLSFTPNKGLNNAAGYYAASDFSGGKLSGYTVVKEGGIGYETKAFPAEGGEVTYGSGYDKNPEYQLDGFVPGDATKNFAEAIAAEGRFPVKVWYVGDGDKEPASKLYFAYSADYPVIIKPTLKADFKSKSVADGVFAAEGVTEKMITLSYPSIYESTGGTTDITDIVVDGASDFRIYPNPAVDVVNVAASAALGTIEIYSVDGRLVKTVEADDTRAAIEVGDLAKGNYIVRAAGAVQQMIKK